MKSLLLGEIDKYRDRSELVRRFYGTHGDETSGLFRIPSRHGGRWLKVIACADGGWDHVSVSKEKRTPSWEEMQQIKTLFFDPHEVVVQYHPADADHINIHKNCLHMWRSHSPFPMPPKWMV